MSLPSPGFLALEPALVDRLTTLVVPQFAGLRVLTAPELAAVSERASQPAPAVHVIYDGFDVTAQPNGLASVTEHWLTVCVVRNVRQADTGAPARATAGPLVDAVFTALLGWRPDSGAAVKFWQPAPTLRPGFDAGFLYVPLRWSAQLKPISSPCPN